MSIKENNFISEKESHELDSLFSIASSPLKMLKNGSKIGLSGVKRVIGIATLFTLINTFLFSLGVIRIFLADYNTNNLYVLAAVLIIGFGFTIFALQKGYQFLIVNLTSAVYNKSTFLVKRFCAGLVEKASAFYQEKEESNGKELEQLISFSNVVTGYYGKAPKFVQNRLSEYLEKIPVMVVISDLKNDIIQGNNEIAAEQLFSKVDLYMKESVFGNNNTKWLFWLLPLNLLIQLILVLFVIN